MKISRTSRMLVFNLRWGGVEIKTASSSLLSASVRIAVKKRREVSGIGGSLAVNTARRK